MGSNLSPLSENAFALTLDLLFLAPLAIAGVALINAGLGRSRSAAQSLLGSLVMASAGVLAFALVGATLADGSAGAGHVFHLAGKSWNWAGTGSLLLSGLGVAPARAQLVLLFECVAIAMTCVIPWGSGADRLRLGAGAAVAAVMGALVFPFVAHWSWGGGWLAQLGMSFGLGTGFVDAGGAGIVHALGGFSALVVVWIAGSRRGKFPREGLSTAMPAHNAVYVLFGCFVALVGWLAWNAAGAVLWLNATPAALPVTAVNTMLSAMAALVATFIVTRTRFGKPDASLCANGWLAGLVTSSACAAVVSPLAAIFTGLVAGAATPCWSNFWNSLFQSTTLRARSAYMQSAGYGD